MTDLADFWRLRKHVEAALEYSAGTHTIDDVAQGILDGKLQCWEGKESIIITEIVVYPRLKDLHYFLAGGDLDEISHMEPIVTAWGKSLGCTRVSIAGRKGWQKSFLKERGYEPKWSVLSKEL
jgi:hypothetical protein